MDQTLLVLFMALSTSDKALFLLRVAQRQTIHARAAQLDLKADAAIEALWRYNEYVHRLIGCAQHVMTSSPDEEWHRSVLAMVIETARQGSDQEARLVRASPGASAVASEQLH